MILWSTLVCGLLLLNESTYGAGARQGSPLEVVKQWNLARFNFEFDAPVNDPDFYNPETVVSTGIAVSYDKIFVATPRLYSGVPATVSYASRSPSGDSPVLQAYPDWSFHAAGQRAYNCTDLGLVSVYRMRIDSCNRLWALDAGVSRSLEDYEITCPPKILVFDLATDQVVRRIDFPREVRRGESLYTNLVIDDTTSRPENNCDDVFVYITDTVEPAIVVYDSGRDLTWRLTHPSMYPDPDFGQAEILGDRFTLMDGVIGIALDRRAGILYYQPFASDRIFSITTAALRAGPPPVNQDLPIRLVGRKSSQGINIAVSPEGTIYFSPVSETAIASWSPNTNQQMVVAYDPEQLQFVADLTGSVYDNGALYALSSKFQRYFLKNINRNEINTRILRIEGFGQGLGSGSGIGSGLGSGLGTGLGASQYQFPYQRRGASRTILPINSSQTRFSSTSSSPSSSVSSQYFSSVRQPYQFAQTKGLANPFTVRGETFPNRKPSTISGGGLYPKISPDYRDFNGLRLAKSVSFNSTVYH